jgi:hypothetical protein
MKTKKTITGTSRRTNKKDESINFSSRFYPHPCPLSRLHERGMKVPNFLLPYVGEGQDEGIKITLLYF